MKQRPCRSQFDSDVFTENPAKMPERFADRPAALSCSGGLVEKLHQGFFSLDSATYPSATEQLRST